jgi:hypothetical protein
MILRGHPKDLVIDINVLRDDITSVLFAFLH